MLDRSAISTVKVLLVSTWLAFLSQQLDAMMLAQ